MSYVNSQSPPFDFIQSEPGLLKTRSGKILRRILETKNRPGIQSQRVNYGTGSPSKMNNKDGFFLPSYDSLGVPLLIW